MTLTHSEIYHAHSGDSVVHMVGGTAALVAAISCGFRGQHIAEKPARFEKVNNKWVVNVMEESNSALVTMGVMFLWFGWYGFNCGSTLGN